MRVQHFDSAMQTKGDAARDDDDDSLLKQGAATRHEEPFTVTALRTTGCVADHELSCCTASQPTAGSSKREGPRVTKREATKWVSRRSCSRA